MTLEQLRNAYEVKPFQHFVIHIADGREIPVPSREFIQAFPNTRTFAVWYNNAIHLIDLLVVTKLEFKPAAPRRRRPAQEG